MRQRNLQPTCCRLQRASRIHSRQMPPIFARSVNVFRRIARIGISVRGSGFDRSRVEQLADEQRFAARKANLGQGFRGFDVRFVRWPFDLARKLQVRKPSC